jgi:hypothetical protein
VGRHSWRAGGPRAGVITREWILVALEGVGAPSASPASPLGCAEGSDKQMWK